MTAKSVEAAIDSQPIGGRPAKGYLPQLDGLRALAVTLVLVHHFITPVEFAGHVGVDVFFVLSGYLITSILLVESAKYGRIRLKRFYVRRAIRLYPPLLLVIAVLVVPGVVLAPSLLRFAAETLFAVTYTTPVAIELVNNASWMWRHTWSLGVEEIFYLLWPLLLIVATRLGWRLRTRAAVALGTGAAMTAVQVLTTLDGDRMSVLLRAGGLFFGCAVALYLHGSERSFRSAWGWAGLGLIAASVVLSTATQNDAIGVLLTVVGTTMALLHAVTGRSALTRALSVPPLAYTGKISYELYLWHYPILVLLGWWTGLAFIDLALVAVPISVAAAVGAHHLLVHRIDGWKQRFPY